MSDNSPAKTEMARGMAGRNAERDEALEQQTATAEVLGVINSSPGDLTPVFETMLEKALSLCEAAFGVLWTSDGDTYDRAALRGVPPDFVQYRAARPRNAST